MERAKITVHLAGFEEFLQNRQVVERLGVSAVKTESSDDNGGKVAGFLGGNIKDWFLYRHIEPNGWVENQGTITWKDERLPGKRHSRVLCNYRCPQSLDGLHALIRSTLAVQDDSDPFDHSDKPTGNISGRALADDLGDLREKIILASWGIAAHREQVGTFLRSQVWYKPKKGLIPSKTYV